MRAIIEKYDAIKKKEEGERDALRRKISECEADLYRLKQERKVTKERHDILNERLGQLPHTNWLEGLVYPLAEALEQATGLHAKVYDVYGIGRASIYLVSDESANIRKDPYLRITLEPGGSRQSGRGRLRYELRDGIRDYAPLPDTIEEIIPLLRGNLEIMPIS